VGASVAIVAIPEALHSSRTTQFSVSVSLLRMRFRDSPTSGPLHKGTVSEEAFRPTAYEETQADRGIGAAGRLA
jgi:hypothetical protein